MTNTIVIGSAFGDEGKARVVDYLAQNHDVVLRYNGGGNAGHTIYHNKQKIVTHLVPSGVCYPNKDLVIGPGVMVDPEALLQEIKDLESTVGHTLNIHLSNQAHIVLKVHKDIDTARERQETTALGSTKRGMAPCAEAKYGRRGVRVQDLIVPKNLERMVRMNHNHAQMLGITPPDLQETLSQLVFWGTTLKKYIKDVPVWLYNNQKSILFEGAQGSTLDIDSGDYPYVSSSSAHIGGAIIGSGVNLGIPNVIGVTKCYNTRVGAGPFPTELTGEAASILRETGGEYGATTGRARRVGWLDLNIMKRAAIISGINQWALTKVDILAGMEIVPVCTHYLDVDTSERIDISLPAESRNLIPIYKNMAGWPKMNAKPKHYNDLDTNLQAFIKEIETYTRTKVSLVCFGPNREDTLEIKDYGTSF